MLTVLDLAQEDTSWNRKASTRKEKKGPCPGCGGTDRFSVKQDDRGRWVFMCRGCWNSEDYLSDKERKRGWGDAYDYLRHYRNMKHDEIKSLLGTQEETPAPQPTQAEKFNHKSEYWQEVISRNVKAYESALWSAEGAAALEYIRGRGLVDDDIIKGVHVGFSMKDGIPRLIFPVYNEKRYTCVYLRDLRPDPPKRWVNALGSTTDELYLADCLRVKRPTILVEAAIDALSVLQECAGMVNVVATGGVDNARSVKSLAQLALMPLVLVAFDADEKGDKYAPWWIERLPNARRLRPFLHDINDMLVDGWDIRGWIGKAIHEQDRQEQDRQIEEIDMRVLCSACLDAGIETLVPDDDRHAHGDLPCCDEHNPGRVAFAELAQQVATGAGRGIMEVLTASEMEQVKEQVNADRRAYWIRQEEEQRERDRARLVAAHAAKMNKYSQGSLMESA